MKTPLLKKQYTNSNYYHFTVVVFFSFIGLILCILFAYLHNSYDEEVALGVNVGRADLLVPYFALGNLPDDMRPLKNYGGQNTQIVSFHENCNDATPKCEDICLARKSSQEDSKQTESRVCISMQHRGRQQLECWETADMRCWGLDTLVFDGRDEWEVRSQDNEAYAGIHWIHIKSLSRPVHMFLFGKGKYRSMSEIEDLAVNAANLQKSLSTVSHNEIMVLAGHSEGAGWAAFLNKWIGEKGRPVSKRQAIGTSTPLSNPRFQIDYNAVPGAWETSIFLLVGLMQPSKLLMDVMPILKARAIGSVTTRQFGYVCGKSSGQLVCIDPQPLSDMDIMKSMQTFNRDTSETLVTILHDFNTYRSCFQVCENYFRQERIDFRPNLPTFTLSSGFVVSNPYGPLPALPPAIINRAPGFRGPPTAQQLHPSLTGLQPRQSSDAGSSAAHAGLNPTTSMFSRMPGPRPPSYAVALNPMSPPPQPQPPTVQYLPSQQYLPMQPAPPAMPLPPGAQPMPQMQQILAMQYQLQQQQYFRQQQQQQQQQRQQQQQQQELQRLRQQPVPPIALHPARMHPGIGLNPNAQPFLSQQALSGQVLPISATTHVMPPLPPRVPSRPSSSSGSRLESQPPHPPGPRPLFEHTETEPEAIDALLRIPQSMENLQLNDERNERKIHRDS